MINAGALLTPTVQLVGWVLVIAGLFAVGVVYGRDSRQDEIDALQRDVQVQTLRADGEAATLRSLKAKLVEERVRRAEMQRSAEAELARLAGRVAELTRASERFEASLRKKASNDEDCTPLRALPVCAPLADGLWGDAAAAGPH